MDQHSGNFEFAPLNEAVNYRRSLMQEFGPFLKGTVLEVGSGIGQLTEEIVALPGVKRLDCVEPEPSFYKHLVSRGLKIQPTLGTVHDISPELRYDALLSVNVLEHIEDDLAELKRYRERLNPGGHLCLFVPASPSVYSDIDRMFGHHRRYRLSALRQLLIQSGFNVRKIHYYNFVGYFAWWLNFRILKNTTFEVGKVRLFDRAIFPFVHGWEYHFLRPPFGQSLLALAES